MLRVEGVELFWRSPRGGEVQTIALGDLRRTTTVGPRGHLLGALEGLGFGLVAGVAVGAIYANEEEHVPPQDTSDPPASLRTRLLFNGAVWGLFFGLLGAVGGGLVGHRSTIEFE